MEDLIQVLKQEVQQIECMVELQTQLQRCLIENHTQKIEQLVKQQENCLLLMQATHKQRVQQLQPWGNSLASVLEQVPDLKIRTQLKALQQKINHSIQQLRHLRRVNQALLEQGLAYIQYATDIYRNFTCAGHVPLYSPYGQAQITPEPVRSFCEFDA